MSEGAAFRRITAARLVKRFPALLERIERGELHLSTLVVLRPHLTEWNVEELAAAAAGKSQREVEELLARLAPKADVRSAIVELGIPSNDATRALTLFGAGMTLIDPTGAPEQVEQLCVGVRLAETRVRDDVRRDIERGLDRELERVLHEPLLDERELLSDEPFVGHGAHFEANARGAVVLDEQLAVAKHAVDQIAGRPVEDDDVDRHAELCRQVGRDVEVEIVERLRRVREQERNVDVARGIRGSSRLAPEEVGGNEALDPCEARDDEVLPHEGSIAFHQGWAPDRPDAPTGPTLTYGGRTDASGTAQIWPSVSPGRR